jgi:IS30 family transposase
LPSSSPRSSGKPLREQVWEWLRADWPPEQTAESLRIEFPGDPILLLRYYWPKGADLRSLTQTDCDDVALRLNTSARKTSNGRLQATVLTPRLVGTAG